MENDKKYIKPIANIIIFQIEDIIADSGDEPWWWGGDVDVGGGDDTDIP